MCFVLNRDGLQRSISFVGRCQRSPFTLIHRAVRRVGRIRSSPAGGGVNSGPGSQSSGFQLRRPGGHTRYFATVVWTTTNRPNSLGNVWQSGVCGKPVISPPNGPRVSRFRICRKTGYVDQHHRAAFGLTPHYLKPAWLLWVRPFGAPPTNFQSSGFALILSTCHFTDLPRCRFPRFNRAFVVNFGASLRTRPALTLPIP